MVRLGREALIVADPDGSPLSHWSFPTIERVEAGSTGGARYAPGEGVSETLEIADPAMVEAVERVRRALARRAPRRRWRRWVPALLVVAAAVMGAARLPDALRGHAVRVAPPEVRRAIGEALATRLSARFGRPCHGAEGLAALDRLTQRLGQPPGTVEPAQIVVLPGGPAGGATLPGGVTVLPARAILGSPDPGAFEARLRALRDRGSTADPLEALLRHAGPVEAARLLTTASVSDRALDGYAASLAANAGASAGAMTEARDASPVPVMTDADWVALQGICEG